MAQMDEKALRDVRKRIGEVMNKEEQKITVGWRPEQVDRNEGDVWVGLDGRQWTKKNGVVQVITKLDGLKTPWWCPKCNTPLNGIHMKAYKKRGFCYNCLEKEEMELKLSGQWRDIVIERGKKSHIDWVKDKIQELQDYHNNLSKPEFIHADQEKILMIEQWHVDLDTVRKDLEEEIQKLKDHLIKVEAGEFDEVSEQNTVIGE